MQVLIAHPTGAKNTLLQTIVDNAGCDPKQVQTFSDAIDILREDQAPILLLSENFDRGQVLELIPVFKHLRKGLKIILLADTTSVGFLRQARAAGIFYHALPPQDSDDGQELKLVLECAREASEKQKSPVWSRIAPLFGAN